ncbi:tRNA (adenosine(37)-N6)-threonylcarbamoyltransferase complex dimerization subunit type 1 TsaB, partial [candidate division GN15 bacterium]|nr:tRNA (adenosine(37)-N6)-threonylcarbamoyltransferase complex dimerization subunit type 1 TsaB [candidate division GN15 bacterium]
MTEREYHNLLAIDTSSKHLVLGLMFGGDRLVQSDNVVEKSHGVILLKKIEELMQSADLSVDLLQGIVVCTGPGSFTGLRIGLAAAKGMAIAAGLPVVGISLFDLFAYKMSGREERLHLLLPSRRGEWYLGTCEAGVLGAENIHVVGEAEL